MLQESRGDDKQAALLFRAAFGSARDSSQVIAAAGKLKTVGEEVNIISHMGFVIDWHLLGPFDAPGKTGFELSFPPEKSIDLTAVYDGKANANIRWKRYQTTDRLGQVNLATAIAPVKEAVGYAYSEINSPRDQKLELRCGADDNLTVWLNGKKVFQPPAVAQRDSARPFFGSRDTEKGPQYFATENLPGTAAQESRRAE